MSRATEQGSGTHRNGGLRALRRTVVHSSLLRAAHAHPHRTLYAYRGTTPTIDGVVGPDEYADAFSFSTADPAHGSTSRSGAPNLWTAQFSEVADAADSSLVGYVKWDRATLYFGFSIRDDFLYGIDGPRWCPRGNPGCAPLTQEGWPWFGDEVELLINGGGREHAPDRTVVGNASEWQMVCSLGKSRLGGIGVAGLCEGEPRQSDAAFRTYGKWIANGALRCDARPRAGASRGFDVEFAVDFSLLRRPSGATVAPGLVSTPTPLGVNIALGDVDTPEKGDAEFGFHHENWLSGTRDNRTRLSQFGTLWLMPGSKPKQLKAKLASLNR